MNRQTAALVGLTAVVCFLLGLVAAGTRPARPTSTVPVRPAVADVRPLNLAAARPEPDPAPPAVGAASGAPAAVDFAAVAARLNTAVVNVDTAARSDDRTRFSRRYPADDPCAPREGSGSGFIIDSSGFILTNHHVISCADRVTVTLSDGRGFKAEVIGVDPVLDVALLKVQAREPLPVATLGNSDSLRVGEWVCAIGNPLGIYVHSVTVGVVSYLGRKLFDQGLDDYIQTDAAISFGNSGGPLINARGEVVGITTAVSPQASNIGFAVPISQVIAVLPQLREHGTVVRGYIGIGLTNVTPALRRALKIEPDRGALVQDVSPDMPAERAGLRPYDVIVGIDGHRIKSDDEFIRYLSGRMPGTLASLDVWRDGQRHDIQVKLKERPLPDAVRNRTPPNDDVRPVAQEQSPLGITVRALDPDSVRRLRIPELVQGVLVSEVDPAGPARLSQIRTNHVIVEVNRRRVTSLADYRDALAAIRPGEAVALLVYERSTNGRIICTVVPDSES